MGPEELAEPPRPPEASVSLCEPGSSAAAQCIGRTPRAEGAGLAGLTGLAQAHASLGRPRSARAVLRGPSLGSPTMDDYFAPPLADKQPPRPPGQAAPPPPVQPLPQSPAQPQGAGDPLVPGNNARPKPSTGGRSMGSKWRRGGGQSMASKSSCSDPSKRNTKLCVALAVAVLLLIVVLIFTFIVLLHVFEVMTLIPAFLPPPECHAPS
ncbi:unnamed protein product [Heligmosomoides polygyrus]|uniref:Col_cuticle_N domain-containing protein n=1 Tax=Heligmosomoides polygyrus TaxID=6339 RepID=A0A183FFX0_HELPZ|nr:unnamed protein product [Heligmosomoides polygyrus]